MRSATHQCRHWAPGQWVYVFRRGRPSQELHPRDRWVGPGVVVLANNRVIYVAMRTRLWRCAPEQLRAAMPSEVLGKEIASSPGLAELLRQVNSGTYKRAVDVSRERYPDQAEHFHPVERDQQGVRSKRKITSKVYFLFLYYQACPRSCGFDGSLHQEGQQWKPCAILQLYVRLHLRLQGWMVLHGKLRGDEISLKDLSLKEKELFDQSDQAEWQAILSTKAVRVITGGEADRVRRLHQDRIISSRMVRRRQPQPGLNAWKAKKQMVPAWARRPRHRHAGDICSNATGRRDEHVSPNFDQPQHDDFFWRREERLLPK